MQAEDKIIRQRILFMPKDTIFLVKAKEMKLQVKKVCENPLIYIIEMNGLHTLDLMYKLNIDVDIMFS